MAAAETAMGGAELPKKRKLLKDVTAPLCSPAPVSTLHQILFMTQDNVTFLQEEKSKGEAVIDAITSTVKKLNPKKKK